MWSQFYHDISEDQRNGRHNTHVMVEAKGGKWGATKLSEAGYGSFAAPKELLITMLPGRLIIYEAIIQLGKARTGNDMNLQQSQLNLEAFQRKYPE